MGKLKAIIGVLVLVGIIYVAWNMIPPYFHKYQLQDDLDDIAYRNLYTHKSDQDLRELIIQKAGVLDIPLQDDQINITRTADGLGITVHYTVHVDMVLHPVDLDFSVNSLNRRN